MIVYVVLNQVTAMPYVGQTTKTLRVRWQGHLAQARTGRSDMPLLVAIREYGPAAFVMEAVQSCTSQEELNLAERAWIDKLGSIVPNGYNTGYGIWRHPNQSARIAAALKGPPCTWGDKIAAAQRGIPISSETQRAALAAGRRAWSSDPRFAIARSQTNGRRRMTDDEIRSIRAARALGESQQSIADRTGYSQTSISRVTRGVRYGYVPQNPAMEGQEHERG